MLIREKINTPNNRREIIVCEFMVSISESERIENIIRTKKANRKLNFVVLLSNNSLRICYLDIIDNNLVNCGVTRIMISF
tara:strand:+ start:1473 stop:1712 length:240 start_codon:yes stop_codon:yes gene_type:complete